jgi:hypothetical protein
MFGGGVSPTSQYALFDWLNLPDFVDTTGRTLKSLTVSNPARTAITLIVGQSLATNLGVSLYAPVNAAVDQINIHDGLCYGLADPVLGANGTAGSLIGRYGDKLIASGRYDRFIAIPAAVGSTTAEMWATGLYQHRLMVAIKLARALNTPITHAIWLQGPLDGFLGTSTADYRTQVLAVIRTSRDMGFSGPWLIAKHTRRFNILYPEIQNAQTGLVNPAAGIYSAGDFDALGPAAFQADGTHLSDTGNDLGSTLFKNAHLAVA